MTEYAKLILAEQTQSKSGRRRPGRKAWRIAARMGWSFSTALTTGVTTRPSASRFSTATLRLSP